MAARRRAFVWRDPVVRQPDPARRRRVRLTLLAALVGLVAAGVVLLALSALRFVF